MKTINCGGHLLNLSKPVVMGILNCTPDSFYDGGTLKKVEDALQRVDRMITDGAQIIDIGGYSSRPDGTHISVEEEIDRVIPVIEAVRSNFPDAVLSCDSFRESVIAQALSTGIHIVNDISAGLLDDNMLETVGKAKVPYIMMHMRGTPQTMKSLTNYEDLMTEVNFYFSQRIAAARSQGINDIIIDPGYGFAKTIDQNFHLLKHLPLLESHGVPILSGLSRKSMIYKTLNTDSSKALNGTTALHMVALLNGSRILRVHDVREAIETVELFQQLKSN